MNDGMVSTVPVAPAAKASAPTTTTTTTSGPPPPWYAGPLFHYLTGVTALAAGAVWLHFGGDPDVATGAFVGGLAFLGVGVGVAAGA
jgi:hypothetical protein